MKKCNNQYCLGQAVDIEGADIQELWDICKLFEYDN